MFSSPAYAQAADSAQMTDPTGGFGLIIIMIAVFWFLIIRPQNKKMKEHRAMVNNVARGDTVVTAGGMIGKVTRVKDDNEVEVELAEGVRVRVVKSTLSDVRGKSEPAKTTTDKKEESK